MYIAVNGYNYTLEPRAGPAVHCRQRYRLISDPNNPTKQASPALWLVQYKRADRTEQANRIPITSLETQAHTTRSYLKQLGHLQEKKFMLADAPNWPAVTLPEAAQLHNALTFVGGQMANRMHMHIQQQQAYAREHGPTPKRARHGTNASQRSAPTQPPPPQVEIDEEDLAESDRRDIFDILTQRDISMMRFKNHEEWMEELFSGYSTFDIKPVDLGFDRAGFMQPITDGFFHRPDRQPTPPTEAWKQDSEHYKNVMAKPFEDGKTRQFAAAVEKRIADNKAQIAEMKGIHDERVKSLSKGSVLRYAAARIRGEQQNSRQKTKSGEIVTAGDETKTTSNIPYNEAESIEQVTKEVEAFLDKNVTTRHEIKLVKKGGLLEEGTSKPKVSSGNGDQMASLFDDFLDVGNSAETSNKPSASPQPPPSVPHTDPHADDNTKEAHTDEWVMVQKQNAQPTIETSGKSPLPASPLAQIDHGMSDMVDFNNTPGGETNEGGEGGGGGAFDDAMHFDNMDTTTGEEMPRLVDVSAPDAAALDTELPATSTLENNNNNNNNNNIIIIPPQSVEEPQPTIPAAAPVLETDIGGPTVVEEPADVVMEMMDESAFGEAFNHDAGGLAEE